MHIFFTIENVIFFKIFFLGGQPLDGGGHVPSVPPGIYAHGNSVVDNFLQPV